MVDRNGGARSVVLLRHTALSQATGICYGRSDLPLAATSAEDIAAVLAMLPAVDRIVSSPATRCRKLAEAAQRAQRGSRVTLTYDERWFELDFGRWEARPWDDVPRADLDAWAADTWNVAPGGGENAKALYARVASALDDLRKDGGAGRTLVVAHAGSLRAANVLLRGLGFEQHFSLQAAPGSWVELELADG